MELTGKCKRDFENWYCETVFNEFIANNDPDFNGEEVAELFWVSPDSMQFGVIQDFADSVGVHYNTHEIVKNKNTEYSCFMQYGGYMDGGIKFAPNYKTRQEARTEAVRQFNNVYLTDKGNNS